MSFGVCDALPGLAFVKFFRFYEAARALEECDPLFRAVFAESRDSPYGKGGPRGGGGRHDSGGGGGGGGGYHPGSGGGDPGHCMGMEYLNNTPAGLLGLLPPDVVNPPHDPEATCSLRLLCAKDIDERNLTFLCEIIPGFRRWVFLCGSSVCPPCSRDHLHNTHGLFSMRSCICIYEGPRSVAYVEMCFVFFIL